MQVYIKARSKAEANRSFKEFGASETFARHYGLNGCEFVPLDKVPLGSAVKIFFKEVDGSPYAISYGTLTKKKDGTYFIK